MTIFQILDANYVYDREGRPVVQLFGSTPAGEPVTCQVAGFRPYFYAGVDQDRIAEASRQIEEMGLEVEVVEKFLPVGYQTRQTKMLKIIAKDPKSVRTFRESVRTVPGIKDVYESDILFKNRFLIDRDLGGMRWAKTEERLVGRGPVPLASLMPDEESLANAPLRHLAFDIECLSVGGGMPQPETDPVIMISLAFSPEYNGLKDLVLVGQEVACPREDVTVCRDERDLLDRFISIVKEYDPDVIAGYNSNGFDFPYLTERARVWGVKTRLGRDGRSWRVRNIANQTWVEITGRIVVDLLPLIRTSFSLKQYTLRNASHELLGMEKGDVDPQEMEVLWQSGGEDFARLVSYSRRDAVLALHLLLKLKLLDKYIALAQTSGSLLQDVINGGQSGMVETLLLRKFQGQERVVPPKPDSDLSQIRRGQSDELKGGAVLTPEKGLVENVIILDYKSLYPTIMMAHNLCYTTVLTGTRPDESHVIRSPSGGEFVDPAVLPGIVPGVLRDLLGQRTEIKGMMRTASEEELPLLDAKQYALKILLNSFYGYSGYARARLYSLPVANAVTSIGRTNIQNTKSMVEDVGSIYLEGGRAFLPDEIADAGSARRFDLSVVYGDTDSVFVRLVPAGPGGVSLEEAELVGSKIAGSVTARLPPPMELEFESFARRGLFLVKKRYALWVFEKVGGGWKDRIKVRGMETVRRDWCELTSRTLNRCLDLVLKEGKVDEAVDLARSAIEKLQNLDLQRDRSMLEDLTLSRRYTKSISSYKNKQPHIRVVEKMRERGGRVPSVGDRVPFVIIRGRGLFVDRAEDPEYAIEKNLKIDTDYYVEKQILPPVLRLLSPFGVTKEQLVWGCKQQQLCELEPGTATKAKTPAPVETTTGTSEQRSLFDF